MTILKLAKFQFTHRCIILHDLPCVYSNWLNKWTFPWHLFTYLRCSAKLANPNYISHITVFQKVLQNPYALVSILKYLNRMT